MILFSILNVSASLILIWWTTFLGIKLAPPINLQPHINFKGKVCQNKTKQPQEISFLNYKCLHLWFIWTTLTPLFKYHPLVNSAILPDMFTLTSLLLRFWAPVYNQCLLRLSAIISVTRIQFNIRHWRWSVTAQLNTWLQPNSKHSSLKLEYTRVSLNRDWIVIQGFIIVRGKCQTNSLLICYIIWYFLDCDKNYFFGYK